MDQLLTKIRFFGRLADLVGREIDFEMPQGARIGDVRASVAQCYPDAAELLASPRIRAAVGDELVRDDRLIQEGEELEFFPPVSGG